MAKKATSSAVIHKIRYQVLDLFDYLFSLSSFLILLVIDLLYIGTIAIFPFLNFAAQQPGILDKVKAGMSALLSNTAITQFLILAVVINIFSLLFTVARIVVAIRHKTDMVPVIKSLMFDVLVLVFFMVTIFLSTALFFPISQMVLAN